MTKILSYLVGYNEKGTILTFFFSIGPRVYRSINCFNELLCSPNNDTVLAASVTTFIRVFAFVQGLIHTFPSKKTLISGRQSQTF